MTPTPELEAAVERLKEFPAGTEGVQSKYVLVHQLRASADIQDVATKRETGWATTSDRADLMRRAANAIERLASLPTGNMASRDHAPGEQRQEPDHPSIAAIKAACRRAGLNEAENYINELESLLSYQQGQTASWRGIAAAMGYEPLSHLKERPTEPWLVDRVAKFRARVIAEAQSLPTGTGEGEAVERAARVYYDTRLSPLAQNIGSTLRGYDDGIEEVRNHCRQFVRPLVKAALASPSSTRSVKP